MDGGAILIREEYIDDIIGQELSEEYRTDIFVTEKSVGRSEWYDAGKSGLNPSIVLETSYIDYNGEQIIEYNGQRYGIYRTYHPENSDQIELYLEEKAGV